MDRSGGCFCRAVRYQITGEVSNVTICHCESCRRVAAAPAVSWLTVAEDAVRWLGAAPVEFESSPGVFRSFCAACGTSIGYRSSAAQGEIDITLCSLDNPDLLAPRDHIHTADKLPWDVIGDSLPQFLRRRA